MINLWWWSEMKEKIKMSIKIMPPNYFMMFIFLEILLHFILPIKKIIFGYWGYFGILFILLGIYLNLAVWWNFKKVKTTEKVYKFPSTFITSGVFRISRNPMYLGMVLILLGESILLGSIISFLFPILLFILINKFTIPIEEKNLEKKFGLKYKKYKKKVRRWI